MKLSEGIKGNIMRDDITAIIKVLGINGAALATVTLADFEALLKVLLLFASLVYTCAKIFLLLKPKKKGTDEIDN